MQCVLLKEDCNNMTSKQVELFVPLLFFTESSSPVFLRQKMNLREYVSNLNFIFSLN